MAKELLVIGASYYALEQLVLSSMAAAKTSYRKAGEVNQETLDHITEALTYVYWGAQNHDLGGLGPFVAVTSQEPLKSNLPLELILPQVEEKIISGYQALSSWVTIEREERSIDIPNVTKAVRNEYAKDLAIRKYVNSEEILLLSKLKVTKDDVFAESSYVSQNLASLHKPAN